MRKRTLSVLLITILTAVNFCQLHIFAEDDVSVTIDGEKIDFDVSPVIIEERTMVPMRKIFEALGAEVIWQEAEQRVCAHNNNTQMFFTIGNNLMQVNEKNIQLDVAPQIIQDRTFVPVRAITESFGNNVEWDADAKTVKILTEAVVPKITPEPALTPAPTLPPVDINAVTYYLEYPEIPDFGAIFNIKTTINYTNTQGIYIQSYSGTSVTNQMIERYVELLENLGFKKDNSVSLIDNQMPTAFKKEKSDTKVGYMTTNSSYGKKSFNILLYKNKVAENTPVQLGESQPEIDEPIIHNEIPKVEESYEDSISEKQYIRQEIQQLQEKLENIKNKYNNLIKEEKSKIKYPYSEEEYENKIKKLLNEQSNVEMDLSLLKRDNSNDVSIPAKIRDKEEELTIIKEKIKALQESKSAKYAVESYEKDYDDVKKNIEAQIDELREQLYN